MPNRLAEIEYLRQELLAVEDSRIFSELEAQHSRRESIQSLIELFPKTSLTQLDLKFDALGIQRVLDKTQLNLKALADIDFKVSPKEKGVISKCLSIFEDLGINPLSLQMPEVDREPPKFGWNSTGWDSTELIAIPSDHQAFSTNDHLLIPTFEVQLQPITQLTNISERRFNLISRVSRQPMVETLKVTIEVDRRSRVLDNLTA